MEYELTHVKGLIKAVQDMVSNYERLKNRLEYYRMCTDCIVVHNLSGEGDSESVRELGEREGVLLS